MRLKFEKKKKKIEKKKETTENNGSDYCKHPSLSLLHFLKIFFIRNFMSQMVRYACSLFLLWDKVSYCAAEETCLQDRYHICIFKNQTKIFLILIVIDKSKCQLK